MRSGTDGRILRAQASRKQVFGLVLPILSDGFIRPKSETRPAGKHRPAIKAAITTLQQALGEEGETAFVTLLNVVEQACNYFLAHGAFPSTYEAMQAIPVLKVGLLTYAGDDGGEQGQAYRLSFDLEAQTATLRLRVPDESGRLIRKTRARAHLWWRPHTHQSRSSLRVPRLLPRGSRRLPGIKRVAG